MAAVFSVLLCVYCGRVHFGWMLMSMSIEEAAKVVLKTVPQFIDWTQTFQHDYRQGWDQHGQACFVYTDGDCGAVTIKESEIFESDGLQIEMVGDVRYCDIDRDSLIDMLYQIEDKEMSTKCISESVILRLVE